MPLRVAFVVNPIAGMGGRVGLKGTDHAAHEAEARGAVPVAPQRAALFLARLRELLDAGAMAEAPHWLTAAGAMGEDLLQEHGFENVEVVHRSPPESSPEDTAATVRAALAREAQVVCFVGGDGTARDCTAAAQGRAPLLGVPSGVKMHSAVFAVHPAAAAELLAFFAQGEASVVEAEVLDVDEAAYRRGEWKVRLYAMAKALDEPMLRQSGKMTFEELHEAELQEDIAAHVAEQAQRHPQRLFLLGPGSTLEAVGKRLGVAKTILGFDASLGGKQVGADLDEEGMLALLREHHDACLVLSPIGAQGFILGRGNQQASPEVVRKVGLERLVLVATPGKLRATPVLRVDSGDPELDAQVRGRGHMPVVMAFRTSRLMPVAPA